MKIPKKHRGPHKMPLRTCGPRVWNHMRPACLKPSIKTTTHTTNISGTKSGRRKRKQEACCCSPRHFQKSWFFFCKSYDTYAFSL